MSVRPFEKNKTHRFLPVYKYDLIFLSWNANHIHILNEGIEVFYLSMTVFIFFNLKIIKIDLL